MIDAHDARINIVGTVLQLQMAGNGIFRCHLIEICCCGAVVSSDEKVSEIPDPKIL